MKVFLDQWKFIAKRKLPLFFEILSQTGQSNRRYYQEVGRDLILKSRLYFKGNVYWKTKEILALEKKLLVREKRTPGFLKKLTEICYRDGDDLINYSLRLKKKDFSKFSNRELIQYLKIFTKKTLKTIKFLNIPLVIENFLNKELLDILSRRVKDQKLISDYFQLFIQPGKINFAPTENRAILKLVAEIQDNKNWQKIFKRDFKYFRKRIKEIAALNKKINHYLDQFAWLTCPYYLGRPVSLADVFYKIKNLLKEDCRKELTLLKKDLQKVKLKCREIMEKYKFNQSEKKFVGLVKEYVYLRTYRTDIYHYSGYNARGLIEEIGRRNGYSYLETVYLSYPELISIFKKKISKKILKERIKEYAAFVQGNRQQNFSGLKLCAFKKTVIEARINLKENKLTGQIAYPGIGRGRVKIILERGQLNKVKNGDILVTSMTTPVFLPAMKRAAALVTDEGGILCHASIIARELKKPCLIGTKIATKVLRDGQLVEVDARAGVVRKLSKQ